MLIKLLVSALGGKPNGTPQTWCFDGGVLLRNIVALVAFIFAVGVGVVKYTQTPGKVAELDNRVKKIEDISIRLDEKITSQGDDLRTIKTLLMGNR